MPELTKDGSKFTQMMSEASTAVSMWRNIGTWTKLSKIPKEQRICVVCGKEATQAEHLVNKAHGGNHTPNNVIPVCGKHAKKRKDWKKFYTQEEQSKIIAATTDNDELRINPYIEENLKDAEELKAYLSPLLKTWRTHKGYI